MKRTSAMKVASALVASVVGVAAMAQTTPTVTAQTTPEVTVQGSRVVKTTIYGAIPIVNVALSYGVSADGLDLASRTGALEFEKRVKDAALAACKELGRQYPNATPNDADCAKAATYEAMRKVHELEAAAAKGK
jgi:UrcA family protein